MIGPSVNASWLSQVLPGCDAGPTVSADDLRRWTPRRVRALGAGSGRSCGRGARRGGVRRHAAAAAAMPRTDQQLADARRRHRGRCPRCPTMRPSNRTATRSDRSISSSRSVEMTTTPTPRPASGRMRSRTVADGPHVEPVRRLVEHDHPRLERQLPGQQRLLDVAAGRACRWACRLTASGCRTRAMSSRAVALMAVRSMAAAAPERRVADALEDQVDADRVAAHDALAEAVVRDVPQAQALPLPTRTAPDRLSCEAGCRPTIDRALARDDLGQGTLAVAVDTGDAQDLALARPRTSHRRCRAGRAAPGAGDAVELQDGGCPGEADGGRRGLVLDSPRAAPRCRPPGRPRPPNIMSTMRVLERRGRSRRADRRDRARRPRGPA